MSEEVGPLVPREAGQIPRPWKPDHLRAKGFTARTLIALIYRFQEEFPSMLVELRLRIQKPDEIKPPSDMLKALLNDVSFLAAARLIGPAQTSSSRALKAFVADSYLGRQLDRSTLLLKRFLRLDLELELPVPPSSVGEHRRGLFGAEDEQLLEILDQLDTLAEQLSNVVVVMRRQRLQRPPAS